MLRTDKASMEHPAIPGPGNPTPPANPANPGNPEIPENPASAESPEKAGKGLTKRKQKADSRFVRSRRLSYKQVVYLCVMAVILVLLFVFVFYSYFSYLRDSEAAAAREAKNIANKVVSQVDERFTILRQYYNTRVTEDDVKDVIENQIDYSSYDLITAARDAFACTTYLDNYVRGYTFVNYRTGWIISNKGMFPISDAVNESDLDKYFQDTDEKRDQYYWVYDTSDPIETIVDRNYRTTLELDGLDYIMRLPLGYNSYAMLIVNVNLDTWQSWIRQCLGEGDQVAVLDADGGVVLYATSSALAQYLEESIGKGEEFQEGNLDFQGEEYVVKADTSEVLGWRYYVFHDVSTEQGGFRMPLSWAWRFFYFSWQPIRFTALSGCCFGISRKISRRTGIPRRQEMKWISSQAASSR